MTEHKPVEIPDEDWDQTPPAVRAFVEQSITRIEQLEIELQAIRPESQAASLTVEPEATSRWRPRRTLNRLALVILAVALAATGQYLLGQDSLWDGLLFYALAAFLFVWGCSQTAPPGLGRRWTGLVEPLQVRPGLTQKLGLITLAGAVVLSLIAYYAFGQKEMLPNAWTFYLYSLAGLLLGVWLLAPGGKSRYLWPHSPLLRWLLVLVFLLAVFMRLWRLDTQPFGVWYDEALAGLEARQILADPNYRPVFFLNHGSHLFMTYALTLHWLGDSIYAMRLVSVFFGILAVLIAYLFGKEVSGPRFGLALAFFVAVARWHVNFSRIAMPGIDTPLFIFLSLFFLARLLKRGRLRDAVGAGVSLGLGFSIYSSFRLFMLALGILILAGIFVWGRVWWNKLKQGNGRSKLFMRLALLGLAFWLTALPIIHFALNQPDKFWDRVQYTSIFNKRDEPELGKALWTSSEAHLLMFNFAGDRNGRHNLPGQPMLDPAMGVLFVLGLAMALAHLRKPVNLFFVTLLPVGLLGGILSLDFEAPQSLRTIAVFPAVVYFCTLAVVTLGRQVEQDLRPFPRSWLAVPGLLLAAYIVWFNAHTYFEQQAQDFASWNAFSTAESIVGKRMAQLGPEYIFYLSPFFNDHPTIRFLSPATPERRLLTPPDALPIRQPADRPAALFIHPDDEWIYEAAQHLYPAGKFETISNEQNNTPVVYIAELTREDVAQVQGLELRYWPNQTWEGPPQTSQPVNMIDLFWPDATSFALFSRMLAEGEFAAEWTGTLYAPDYGLYTFTLRAPAAASLEIDGNNLTTLENGGQQLASLTLAQGNHRLRLRALGGIGPVSLMWQRPGYPAEVVPQWALYRPPVTNHGLLGNFYANAGWEGEPALARIDPFLDMYFHLTPLPRPYTAEWSGVLDAPQEGLYAVGLRAMDWAQLYLDDRLVVETSGPDVYTQADVTLKPGLHDIRLRFKDTSARSRLHLWWQPPGQPAPAAIPAQYLWPSLSSVVESSPVELLPETLVPSQAIPLPVPSAPSAGQMTIVSTNVGEPPLNQPRGIAVGSNGQVYVADSGNRRLLILDQAGNLVAQATGGAEPFDDLTDVAVDGSGRIFVLDAGRGRVSLFDAEGQYLNEVPAQEVYTGRSRGLFVDNQNRLWLANTSASRVVALDLTGNLMAEIPIAPGMPAQPVDVVMTPEGPIFVTDVILDQLLHFGPDARQQQSWIIPHSTSIDGPHLAVDAAGGLYLTLPETGQVLHLDANGQAVDSWELHRPDGGLMRPVGIAVDTTGQVWVVDSAGGYLIVLTR